MKAPEWIESLPDGVDPDGVLAWVQQMLEPLAQSWGLPWQAVAVVLLVGAISIVFSIVEKAVKILVVGGVVAVLVLLAGRFLF